MRIRCLLALAALSCLVPVAHADTVLSPVVVNVRLDPGNTYSQYGGTSAPPTGTYSLTDLGGTVTGTYQLGSDPQVSTTITFSGTAPVGSQPPSFQAISQVIYQFVVNGPTGQLVPVEFAASGSASASDPVTGGLGSAAFFTVAPINSPSFRLIDESAVANAPTPLTAGFTFDQTISVLTNQVYSVNIDTRSNFVDRTGTYSARSFVDPTITLATNDPGYALQFSPGLLDATTTPEPSSLVLLGTGVMGATLFARRRKLA